MSFLSVLKTIGSDIEKGLKVAEPIVAAIPGLNIAVAPILSEVATILGNLEAPTPAGTAAGPTLTAAQISALIQAVVASAASKQVASAAAPAVAPPA
jgi:hypothetical protein